MYSPAVARSSTSMPSRLRPLGRRTQMMARGPGWRLAEGEAGCWQVVVQASDDPVLTWAHMLRTLRSFTDSHGLRPLVLDLRGGPRLGGPAAEAAALLFAEFENRGLRISVLVGHDLIQAARLHGLLARSAAAHGRCHLTEAEAFDWVRRSAPPVPAPIRVRSRGPALAPPRV